MKRIIFLCIVCILLVPASGLCTQVVNVVKAVEPGTSQTENKKLALQEGFAQAAVQAATELVSGELSEVRKELLKEYLAPRSGELVQSYTEEDFKQTFTELYVTLNVRINRNVLKKMLKGIGVLYTSEEPWPYTLDLQGSDAGDWKTIDNLQVLSGLVPTNEKGPTLRLEKTENKIWQAELKYGNKVFKDAGQDLNIVWSRIWPRYFTLPEIQVQVSQNLILIVEGWPDAGSMTDFNKTLSGWDKFLEEATLLEVSLKPDLLAAKWRIMARNKDMLRQNLQEYLYARGLEFALREGL